MSHSAPHDFGSTINITHGDESSSSNNPWRQWNATVEAQPRLWSAGQMAGAGQTAGGLPPRPAGGAFKGGLLKSGTKSPPQAGGRQRAVSAGDLSSDVPPNLISRDWNPAHVPSRAFLTPQPGDVQGAGRAAPSAVPLTAGAAAAMEEAGRLGKGERATFLGPLFSDAQPPLEASKSLSAIEGVQQGAGGAADEGRALLPLSRSADAFPAWTTPKDVRANRRRKFDPLDLPSVDLAVLSPLMERFGGEEREGSRSPKKLGGFEGGDDPATVPTDVKNITDVMSRNSLRKLEAAMDEQLLAWALSEDGPLHLKEPRSAATSPVRGAAAPRRGSVAGTRGSSREGGKKDAPAGGEARRGGRGRRGSTGGGPKVEFGSDESPGKQRPHHAGRRRSSGGHLVLRIPAGGGDGEGDATTGRASTRTPHTGDWGRRGDGSTKSSKTPNSRGRTPNSRGLAPRSIYLGEQPDARGKVRMRGAEDEAGRDEEGAGSAAPPQAAVLTDGALAEASWGLHADTSHVVSVLGGVHAEVVRQVAGSAPDRAQLVDSIWKERLSLFDRASRLLLKTDTYAAEVRAAALREKARARVDVNQEHERRLEDQAARRAALEARLGEERAKADEVMGKRTEVEALSSAMDNTGREHGNDVRRLSKLNKDLAKSRYEAEIANANHDWMLKRKEELGLLIDRAITYLAESPEIRDAQQHLDDLTHEFKKGLALTGPRGLTPRPVEAMEVPGLEVVANSQARMIALDAKLAAADQEVEYLRDRLFQWNVLQLRRERYVRWQRRYRLYLELAAEYDKDFFTSRGKDCPARYLRSEQARVANKMRLSRRDTVRMVREIWRDKKATEQRLSKKIALNVHISDYFIRLRGIGHQEQLYAFVAALKKFEADAEVRLMWCVLVGEVDEAVHEDQQALVEGLRYTLGRMDRESHGQRETGQVHLAEIKVAFRHFLHNMSDPRYEELMGELMHDIRFIHYPDQNVPEMVEWKSLFTEFDPDDDVEHKFLEKIRSLHLTDVLEYLRDVEVAILMQLKEEQPEQPEPMMQMTLAHAYTALKDVDPHRKGKFLNSYLERGFAADTIHAEATVAVQEFVDNLSRGMLKRRSVWDTRMALAQLLKNPKAKAADEEGAAPSGGGGAAAAAVGRGRWGAAARGTGVSGHKGYKRSIMLALSAARKMQGAEVGRDEVVVLQQPTAVSENQKRELVRRASISALQTTLDMTSVEGWSQNKESAMSGLLGGGEGGLVEGEAPPGVADGGDEGGFGRLGSTMRRRRSTGGLGENLSHGRHTIDEVMQEMNEGAVSFADDDEEEEGEDDEAGPYVQGLRRGFTMNRKVTGLTGPSFDGAPDA